MNAQPCEQPDGRNRQGTAPDEELRLLLAEIGTGRHWRTALETLGLPTLSAKRHWMTDTGKALFYASLTAAGSHRALDVGAGSGVIAEGLSAQFERVVALEHDAGWSEFMRVRFAQDRLPNIEVVHGSATALPFDADTFDLVVVNGVLEWIPDARTRDTPREAQLRFLEDARRVLRAAGAIGIAIENRISLWNLRGASPHAEPAYAAILPRSIANWYTRRVQGRDYRNWIYTYWGYRRLLRSAGFRDIVIQQVQPTYHTPQEVLRIDRAREARRYFRLRRPASAALVDLLASIGALGYLAHSFYIQARK